MGLNTKKIKKILKCKKAMNFGRVLNHRGFVSFVTILVMFLGLIGAGFLWRKEEAK